MPVISWLGCSNYLTDFPPSTLLPHLLIHLPHRLWMIFFQCKSKHDIAFRIKPKLFKTYNVHMIWLLPVPGLPPWSSSPAMFDSHAKHSQPLWVPWICHAFTYTCSPQYILSPHLSASSFRPLQWCFAHILSLVSFLYILRASHTYLFHIVALIILSCNCLFLVCVTCLLPLAPPSLPLLDCELPEGRN